MINPRERDPKKHHQIIESIASVGLKKPIKVSLRRETGEGGYDLVFGQGRLEAFMALGAKEIPAIVVDVPREDRLLMSLVENMARKHPSPAALLREIERLKTLGYSNVVIGRKIGISDSAVGGLLALAKAGELLKDKHLSPAVFYLLKKVKPLRQIEMTELMISANNFSKSYARALVMGTLKEHLLNPEEPKKARGMTPEEIARMEEEMQSLHRDFKAVETSFGETVLNLTLAKAYLGRLLDNAKIVKFLLASHEEYLHEFQRLTATERL